VTTRRNITIDFASLVGLDDRAKEKRSKRIAAALWSRWRGMARTLPSRYRQAYMSAMQMKVQGSHVEFSLAGDKLARSVEYGFGPGGVGTQGPYDMRKTLLRSGGRSVRVSRRGDRYLRVPIGMSTRRMRSMPGGSRAYQAARQLEVTSRGPGGKLLGGRLPKGMTPKLRPQGRRVPGIGYVPPHRTDPTHGLRRYSQGVSGGSTYGTFRTISQGGKPWVHPGIKARRFIRKMSRQVKHVVREVG
jgi:hypothetical protein